MSWSDEDIATATETWSDEDVVAPVVLPKATKPAKQFVSNEAAHFNRLVKTAGRIPFELGIAANKLVGTPHRPNPIESQGPGYDLAGDLVTSAIPGAAAGKAVTKLPLLKKTLQGPGFFKAAGRSAAAGAAGGAAGAAALGEDVSDGAVFGGVAGPALSLVGNAGNKIIRGGKKLFETARDRTAGEIRHIFGDRTDDAITALRNVKENVPGEQMTAGAAASAKFPEFKVLEEGARSRPGADKFLQLDAENEAARLAAIEKYAAPGRRGVAPAIGAPVPPSTLESVRYRKTEPLYEAAFKDRVPLSIKAKQALTGAEVLPLNLKGAKAFDQNRANAMAQGGSVPGGSSTGGKTISIKQLQAVKEQVTKEINTLERATDAAGIARKQRLIEARDALTAEMKKASPRYAKANDTYAKLMLPQNQSNVAQQLVTALRSPSGAERVPAFLGAMKNAPLTIQRAGAPRFKQIEQIASPEQLRAYKGVQSSLERQAAYDALGTKPGIVPQYLSPYDKLAKVTPRLFDQVLTTIKAGVQHLGRRSDTEVRKVISDAMLDPNKMADLMAHVPPSQRSKVAEAFSIMGNDPAAIGAVAGSSSTGDQ